MRESGNQPFEQTSAGGFPVRGFLHLPAIPSGDALVLTRGAGANIPYACRYPNKFNALP